MNKVISIVVPVFNEGTNIVPLFARLTPVLAAITEEFGFRTEVVITDNCSTDDTAARLADIVKAHDQEAFDLKIFRFSRNIGFQRSILVGYGKASGDAVVQIDADLQDPPELILEFIRRWLDGSRVVYGVRRKRQENPLMTLVRKVFYRALNTLSDEEIPPDSGDFRLIDRVIVDVVCMVKDQDPYLRGLIASLGFAQEGVVYDRDARLHGESKFGLMDLFKLATDGFTNHSVGLLRLSSYFAFLVAVVMFGFIFAYLYLWLLTDKALPIGFMTQTLLELGGVAVISMLFSIHGAYLSRIYRQVKQRPIAIIEESNRSGEEGKAPEIIWAGERTDED